MLFSVKPRIAVHQVERLESRRLLSDVISVGPEFRVNTYTTGAQWLPSAAMDADGDFTIVWESAGQDGSGSGIYGQRFGRDGQPHAGEFRVNTQTINNQQRPAIVMAAAGNSVVTWAGHIVSAQRYGTSGKPSGEEFLVSPTVGTLDHPVAVAADSAANFVVAWFGGSGDVYARRYDSAGQAQGEAFLVNNFTTGTQKDPRVAMDPGGDFVITWTSEVQDGSFDGVYAQRFDAAGTPQGAEFRVNTYTTSAQGLSEVGCDAAGNFVIVWRSFEQDGSLNGVYGQRYDSQGVAQGGELRVNAFTTGNQWYPSVAVEPAGGFIVAWFGAGSGDGAGIFARRYDAAGLPLGDEFRVNGYTTGSQRFPTVAMDPDGDFVVAWTDYAGRDGSEFGVYAQRYAVVPQVSASSFHFATRPHQVRFNFDRDVSGSLGTDDLVVQNLTTMQTVPSGDFSLSYDTTTNVATFTYTGTTAGIAGMLPDGRYAATLLAAGVTTAQGAPLAADVVLSFRFLQGDANNDGRVNLEDFNILAGNFGQSPRDFTQGDFDYSGNVNLNDFNLLAARFGQVLAAPAAPAPTGRDQAARDRWLDDWLA